MGGEGLTTYLYRASILPILIMSTTYLLTCDAGVRCVGILDLYSTHSKSYLSDAKYKVDLVIGYNDTWSCLYVSCPYFQLRIRSITLPITTISQVILK